MNTRLTLVPLLVLTLAGAANAADAPKQETRSCFRNRDVNSWSAVDERTVNLKVGVSRYYQLDLLGPCHDIDWNLAIGLESRGSDWICSGLDATLIVPKTGYTQRCPVRSVRRLSDEEVAALKGKDKP